MTSRLLTASLVAAAALAWALSFTARPAAAAVGDTAKVVVEQSGSTAERVAATNGAFGSSFSLDLPRGAACSGDSATGLYRVQSFMIPAGVDPASLTFGSSGPVPLGKGANFRQPLYDVATQPYVNALTDISLTSGGEGPGTIINVPMFSLGVFAPADVPAGKYTVGIACTKGPASRTQLDRYWTSELDLTAAGTAGALQWRAAGAAAKPSAAAGSPSTPVAPASEAAPSVGVLDAASASAGAEQAAPKFGGDPSFQMPLLAVPSFASTAPGRGLLVFRWVATILAVVRFGFLLFKKPAVLEGLSRP